MLLPLILGNVGLVPSRNIFTSLGGASLALVGHSFSDGIVLKIYYGADVLLHQPALHLILTY